MNIRYMHVMKHPKSRLAKHGCVLMHTQGQVTSQKIVCLANSYADSWYISIVDLVSVCFIEPA